MPHVTDSRAILDHDRHDLLLVAALAAGDLAGADRDHARDLTRSCAACAELHDDLVAIARATASVPPPVAARPRDFQLTAADAARLRPGGWRRLAASLSGLRSAATRPLGAGLATIGIVGLLLGNVTLNLGGGSSAAAPRPVSDGAGGAGVPSTVENAAGSAKAAPSSASAYLTNVPGPSAAASAGFPDATAIGPVAGGVASSAPDRSVDVRAAQGSGTGVTEPQDTSTSGGPIPAPTLTSRDATVPGAPAASSEGPLRPLNVAFGLAVLGGVGLLVASRRRSRSGT